MLATWLRGIGYAPRLCGFVANMGCADRALDQVEQQVEELERRFGRRVALIGHSRGGHYARVLGHRRPQLVSHAISIGAGCARCSRSATPPRCSPPVLFAAGARRVVLRTGRARSSRCLTGACDCAFGRDFTDPFPDDHVRLTSIYSKGDGVVRWQAALVSHAHCVEVTGSHVGLIFNRKTYRAIATALAEPELKPDPSGGSRC